MQIAKAPMEEEIVCKNCANDFAYFEKHWRNKFKESGDVYSWGSGEMGQLGYDINQISKLPKDRDGYPFQPSPTELVHLSNKNITQISAGEGYSVAIDMAGNLFSWGASACGQLGISSLSDLPTDIEGYPFQPIPTLIEPFSQHKVMQIACGDAHTVALVVSGQLYSWGGGGCGQLGHADTICMPKDEDGCPYLPKPRLIDSLKELSVGYVACGKAHTISLLLNSGGCFSWGAAASGQLGHPDTNNFPTDEDGYPYQPIPKSMAALKEIELKSGSCGDVNTLVLTGSGRVYSFGGGSFGQLGLGHVKDMPLDVDNCPYMPIPKIIESIKEEEIVQVECGDSHSMALNSSGQLFAWGAAACGQLGLEDTTKLPKDQEGSPFEPIPQLVSALTQYLISSVSCGEAHTLAVTDQGYLFSFGASSCGQLGQSAPPYLGGGRGDINALISPKCQKVTQTSIQRSQTVLSQAPAHDSLAIPHTSPPFTGIKGPLGDPKDEGGPTGIVYHPVPKIITGLMSRRVSRIASGGVHNICIVRPLPYTLPRDLYTMFATAKYTDFCIIANNYLSLTPLSARSFVQPPIPPLIGPGDIASSIISTSSSTIRIHCHKCILSARCPYFKHYFSTHKAGREIQVVEDYNTIRALLDYVYLCDLSLIENIKENQPILKLMRCAKKYGLNSLATHCEKKLSMVVREVYEEFDRHKVNKNVKKMHKVKRGGGGGNVDSFQNNLRLIGNKLLTSLELNNEGNNVVFLPDGRIIVLPAELYSDILDQGVVLTLNEEPDEESTMGVSQGMGQGKRGQGKREGKQSKEEEGENDIEGVVAEERKETTPNTTGASNNLSLSPSPAIQLGNALIGCINNQEYSDIKIVVEKKTIYLNKVILASRSKYFKIMLGGEFREKGESSIILEDISYDIFMCLCEHIYSDATPLRFDIIFELMQLVDRFEIEHLRERIEIEMVEYLSVENACKIFKFANRLNYERLRETALIFINKNYNEIIDTDEFEELEKEDMLKIVRYRKNLMKKTK